jgi:hypothetical protein
MHVTDDQVFLCKVMSLIEERKEKINNRPFAYYALTGYVILAAIKRLLELDPIRKALCASPKIAFEDNRLDCALRVVNNLLLSLIIGINHELSNNQMLDYKSELKSRTNVDKFLNELVRSYQKDMMRGKVDNIGDSLRACQLDASAARF